MRLSGTRPPEIGHKKHERHEDQNGKTVKEAMRVHLEVSKLGRAREMSNHSSGILFAKLLPGTFGSAKKVPHRKQSAYGFC